MEHIAQKIEELIGHTPLLETCGIEEEKGLKARLLVKLESFNPAGSVKDRTALSMIQDAEEKGLLGQGAVIIEPTSGNTGIGLASIGVSRGYRVIFTMPETMSVERRKLLKGYGAEIVLTPGAKGMAGAIEEADRLARETDGGIVLGQFVNQANPAVHYRTTGPEIWEDTDGEVDIFVAGVGTGGTITGTGRFLRERNPKIRIVAVEPAKSCVLSGGQPGPHGLQGIGAGFVPEILDAAVYNQVTAVKEEEAYEAARLLARREGILAGISSGAALWAGIRLAEAEENAGKTIVVLLPDTGERYLSTPLFEEG